MSMICDLLAVSPPELERLHSDPDSFDELADYNNRDAPSCSLEKAWHGLHYLLTGEAWESDGPLAFIAAGGTTIDGSDCGYGDARSFTPDEARGIAKALSTISDEQLWSRFDRAAMTAAGIYPMIWDESEADLKQEYTDYLREVKKFIEGVASQGQGLVVMLT
jgi:hypothetical protein